MDDDELENALGDAIPDEYICQGLSVEDGKCRIFLKNAPGAPREWGVQLTATPERIVAYFCSHAACGTAASKPKNAEAGKADYERFLRDPVAWSKGLWGQFSDFADVRWHFAGEELKMVTV